MGQLMATPQNPVSCTQIQENWSWYIRKCSTIQNSLSWKLSSGQSTAAPATPCSCVVPARKQEKAAASHSDPQWPDFKPGLGLSLLSCCLGKFLFLLTFSLVHCLLTQEGSQSGLLPFWDTRTFDPPFSISPANKNQGNAKLMHYHPRWNWEETGFLEEETGIL